MTRLTITRRLTDRGTAIYACFDPADPADAEVLARLLANRKYDTARVEADFSPATSGALNVPLRSEVEAERDRLRALLVEARRYLWRRNLPSADVEAVVLLDNIDAALPLTPGAAA